LIGFGGAPFTLAAYLVEGRPSRDHLAARGLMHSDPATWDRVMTWAADLTGAFLRAQVEAGARAVQLFDSWAGGLSLGDYTAHAAPYSARALSHVKDLGVPIVHFGTGTSELLGAMRDAGADVVGIDYRLPLDEASRRLGGSTPLQGNIDPALLTAPWEVLEAHVRDVVERGRQAPSHVLNLGHGVPPTTDPGVLTQIVELAPSRCHPPPSSSARGSAASPPPTPSPRRGCVRSSSRRATGSAGWSSRPGWAASTSTSGRSPSRCVVRRWEPWPHASASPSRRPRRRRPSGRTDGR